MRNPQRPALLFLCAAGAAGFFFGLPNAVLHLPFAALLHPFCLYLIASRAASDGEVIIYGWLQGFLSNAAGLYWLAWPMLDVADMPPALVLPLLLALYALLACYSALAAFAARSFRLAFAAEDGAGRRIPLPRDTAPPVMSGLAYGGFEVLNSVLFSGFPWLTLSSAFAFFPVMLQGAAYTGGYALSAVYAATACLCASLQDGPGRTGRACAALLIPAALFVCGVQRLSPGAGDRDDKAGMQAHLRFTAVQGNIDQARKWDRDFQTATVEHYIRLSEKALAEEKNRQSGQSSLVVWPETAMPFYFSRRPELDGMLRRFAAGHAVYLAFGGIARDEDRKGAPLLHNSLFLLSPQGKIAGRYDKTHLVPFGEYVPVVDDIAFLRGLLQGMSFSPGTAPRPLVLDGPPPLSLGPLICYEAVFPYPAQEQVRQGADILLNVSNDAWFRKSSAPLQHLAHSAVRAVEQARPLIRATNTGISAVFDAEGRLTTRVEGLFTEACLQAEVTAGAEATLYHRLSPLPELFLAATAATALVLGALRRRAGCRNATI
ncbi:MAG: apolipoprotein N-acyltransferase [Desulfovibrio sp.]|jgi:apolipoprotein N-acyltransferase|nr:apolipoprotein N-acyltransferase [Desulfovibrio sp.]